MKVKDHLSRKEESLKKHGVLNPHPEMVEDPLFQEEEFFDPGDLVQVKYEMIRRVVQNGEAVKQVVGEYGFSRPSFYKARQDFSDSGLSGLFPGKRGPRKPHKLTEKVMEFLEKRKEEDPELASLDLSIEVEAELGTKIHPRTIDRILKSVKKKRN